MCVTYFTFISGDLLRRGLLVDKLKWLRLNYGFGVRQISSLATTKVVRNLPLIQVEVLATTREEMLLRETNVNLLCHLVLDWIQRNWESSQLNVDQLTAKVLFLLLLLLLLPLFFLFSSSFLPLFSSFWSDSSSYYCITFLIRVQKSGDEDIATIYHWYERGSKSILADRQGSSWWIYCWLIADSPAVFESGQFAARLCRSRKRWRHRLWHRSGLQKDVHPLVSARKQGETETLKLFKLFYPLPSSTYQRLFVCLFVCLFYFSVCVSNRIDEEVEPSNQLDLGIRCSGNWWIHWYDGWNDIVMGRIADVYLIGFAIGTVGAFLSCRPGPKASRSSWIGG